MKYIKISALKIAIVAVVVLLAFQGCKKENNEKSKLPIREKISISNLKTYVSKLIDVDTLGINFDPKRQLFITDDLEIRFDELLKMYKEMPIVEYKNGSPIYNN